MSFACVRLPAPHEQDDDLGSSLQEVEAVPGPMVDPHLRHALAHRLAVPEVAGLRPIDARLDPGGGPSVAETLEPPVEDRGLKIAGTRRMLTNVHMPSQPWFTHAVCGSASLVAQRKLPGCLDEEPQWHGALFVTAIAWAYVERYRPARRVGAWPVHQRRRTATTCSSWSDAVEDLVGLFGLPARPLPKITCRLAPALHAAAVGPRLVPEHDRRERS